MMNGRNSVILSVAEKPSVAKQLANIISNNQYYNTRNGHSVYNKIFEIPSCSFMGQPNYSMKMTSVRGHILDIEFDPKYKLWHECQPIELFTAPIQRNIKPDCRDLQRTLEEESRGCSILLLWLDCDLEGENISYEVIQICTNANPNLNVYRARFSALIPRDIFRTLQYPDRPNLHFNHAVEARQEIDLRLGAAFTRFQTLRLQKKFENLSNTVISYGPCQFPTLGFVVERYLQIQKFQSEMYWSLVCDFDWSETSDSREKLTTHFKWDRGCVYDHFTALILYENCLYTMDNLNDRPHVNENNDPNAEAQRHEPIQPNTPSARVVKCDSRPTSRIRPCPMNTIELQRRASRFLNMGSDRTMAVAEALYQRGILSYPRTETDFFKEGFELLPLVQEQRNHSTWGVYASSLLDNEQGQGDHFNPSKFEWPRAGGHDDAAHPPIHPLKSVELNDLTDAQERSIYDLVTRHFLASCSKDGRGEMTTLAIQIPATTPSNLVAETFSASGLMITERNWLDIYGRFEKWSASKVPNFKVGDTFQPSAILLSSNKTIPPLPISESDLISDMDKNGIGTDATIATHIATIQQREYVTKLDEGNRFVPTKLGLALIEAYNEMGYQLNKPFLRASMERDCQRIAKGELDKNTVVRNVLEQMRLCYETCFQEAFKLDQAVAKHFSKTGMDDIASYVVVQRNLSSCGKCRNKMDLRIKRDSLPAGTAPIDRATGGRRGRRVRAGRGRGRGGRATNERNPNNDDVADDNDSDSLGHDSDSDNLAGGPVPENVPRHLHCSTCADVKLLPPKGSLSANELLCPICNYQVLNIHNPDTNKDHTICPSCFSDPPQVPLSDGSLSDFRCLSCAHASCALAGRTQGSEVNIAPCYEQNCQGFMKLKKTKGGGYMIACASSRNCNRVWWFPKSIKTAVPTNEICEGCRSATAGRVEVMKLHVTIALATAPPGTPPESVVCPCCNDLWRQFGQEPLRRKCFTVTTDQRTIPGNTERGAAIISRTASIQPTGSTFQFQVQPDVGLRCKCNVPGRIATVQKDGANKGRQFYSCATNKCNFFQWFEEAASW